MARAESVEVSAEERQYHQEFLTGLFKWIAILSSGTTIAGAAAGFRAVNRELLISIGQGVFGTALLYWCFRRVRRGDLLLPARTFLVMAMSLEVLYMLNVGQPLRLTGGLAFALLTMLAVLLEKPRLTPWWTVAAVSAYTLGCFLPRLLGWRDRPIAFKDEVLTFAALVGLLLCVVFLSRSTVRHLRRALTKSENVRHSLEATTAKLEQQRGELQSFTYVVAHDLRAPLRALMNYSRFLQEDCVGHLDETCREYIQGIGEGARRMDALVNDLLEYARIGRDETELALVELGPLLERVVTSLGLREKADVTLPVAAPALRGREVRLTQVFSNLLDNAVKFQRPGVRPAVTVECVDRGDAWALAVRDNGIGIEEKHFDRIFGVFQRLHAQEEYEGTGVGLAIVKKAIEEHGGKVWVESAPGQGSVFRFTLPKAGPPEDIGLQDSLTPDS